MLLCACPTRLLTLVLQRRSTYAGRRLPLRLPVLVPVQQPPGTFISSTITTRWYGLTACTVQTRHSSQSGGGSTSTGSGYSNSIKSHVLESPFFFPLLFSNFFLIFFIACLNSFIFPCLHCAPSAYKLPYLNQPSFYKPLNGNVCSLG